MIKKILYTMLFSSLSNFSKRETRVLIKLLVVIVLINVMIAILTGVAYANVRRMVPDQDPYAPIYADFYGNEDLVAFFFYRDPDCVPDDFDLYYDFFDNNPRVFDCDLTVKGFVIYRNPGDFVPKQAKLEGLGAVPVWFVSKDDFENAISVGSVTIVDLENMESLQVGSASFYSEVLHPEGHPEMPMKIIEAKGTLENGKSFLLNSIWVGSWPTPVNSHMTILFK